MYQIKKLRDDQTVEFAAFELKKYLRMMMPECGDISICYDPEAKDGFRLGLLEDFGLPNEAEDVALDDIVHIDTDPEGGILAGSNPRSVLFAVYRFLRLNGCRWLFAGMDGEFIPRKNIEPQKYHKLADYRYRGHTTEGDPSFRQIMDYIDFHPKLELNSYGLTDIHTYHYRYYKHSNNEMNREPEPVSASLVDQYHVLFQAEILRRGLIIGEGGHSLLPASVGLHYSDRAAYKSGEKQVPEEIVPFLALLGGKRALHKNDIYYTNMCMSNPEWRKRFVNTLADFAQANMHLSMIAIPLADGHHNHCECEKCTEGGRRPSDWRVLVANDLADEMDRRGLHHKIYFSTYVDAMFPPVVERLKKSNRFFIQFTPISRSYSASLNENSIIPEPAPYEARNVWEAPKSMEQCISHLLDWRKQFDGPCRCFDYHFWRAQYRDPGLAYISRRVYEDVRALKIFNIQGYMQDGSNKSFFPHGFHHYIYSESLVNRDCDYEAELADYMETLYGEDWKQVSAYLNSISEAFGEKYMAGEDSADIAKGRHYNPDRAKILETVPELAANARALAKAHRVMPTRPQTVAYRMLERHAEYCELLAQVMIAKAKGYDKLALEKMQYFKETFGKYDWELENYLDLGLAMRTLTVIAKQMPNIEF